jgi:diguanylate cyclase (GGDEF)-like protein
MTLFVSGLTNHLTERRGQIDPRMRSASRRFWPANVAASTRANDCVSAAAISVCPPSSAWQRLSSIARLYAAITCAIGVCVIGWSAPALAGPHRLIILTIMAVSLPASMVKASLHRSVPTLTLCQVVDLLTLLLLGTEAAVLVAAAGAWGQCTFRSEQRTPVHQTAFSIASVAIATQAAGMLYSRLGGHVAAWEPSSGMVPYSAATTALFVVNSLLVAGAIGFSTGHLPARVWFETFTWSWPGYLLGAGVAAAASLAIGTGGYWLVVFLAIPLASTFHNLRSYVNLLDESVTDWLTGLPNQRVMLPHITREIGRARRTGSRVAVVLLDVDRFKSVNDTYGHRVGDNALKHIAKCLRQSIRAHDVCARYGGDEFLIVLTECDAVEAERKSRFIQWSVAAADLRVRTSLCVPLAVSVGTAVYPDDAATAEELVEIADARMYQNKFGRKTPPTVTS